MESRHRDNSRDGERRKAAVARIVQTRDRELPYKVIISDEDGKVTEHAFATMQQCEAFIRRHLPIPTERSKLYDREPGEA